MDELNIVSICVYITMN